MKSQYSYCKAAECHLAKDPSSSIFSSAVCLFLVVIMGKKQSVINTIMINYSTQPWFTHLPNCKFLSLYFKCLS